VRRAAVRCFDAADATAHLQSVKDPSLLGRLLPQWPVSWQYGFDRGHPVDRRYIEGFLEDHRGDIAGAVLEVGDATYIRRFGGDRVSSVDVLHVDEGHPETTIVADPTYASHLPDAAFDCVVCCQTVHLIYDVQVAVRALARILRPRGVLLLTVPGISQLTEQEGWGHFWTFTDRSVQRLLDAAFEESSVHVYGNVRSATAFLYGLAEHELPAGAFDPVDRRYPVTVAARAGRSSTTAV